MTGKRSRSEFDRIQLIERLLGSGRRAASAVEVGIGDDAAVLISPGKLVWTIDAQVDGIHFNRRWLELADIGYRAFQAAASDLAAMGARPLAAIANLSLPTSFSDFDLEQLVKGQAEASAACRCALVGGNLARASELSITTSVLGSAERPLLRKGAKVGDELWLLGAIGEAALGLLALQRGARRTKSIRACIEHWRRPRALLAAGVRLQGRARAAIDISDGLGGDAGHLAQASRVRLLLDAAQIEAALSADARSAAAALGESALQIAISGGEDYALLAAGPAASRPRQARVIGTVERGRGVVLRTSEGTTPVGGSFDHFRKGD